MWVMAPEDMLQRQQRPSVHYRYWRPDALKTRNPTRTSALSNGCRKTQHNRHLDLRRTLNNSRCPKSRGHCFGYTCRIPTIIGTPSDCNLQRPAAQDLGAKAWALGVRVQEPWVGPLIQYYRPKMDWFSMRQQQPTLGLLRSCWRAARVPREQKGGYAGIPKAHS